MKRCSRGESLPAPIAERVRQLVENVGEPMALSILGISRPTLGRVCGALRIYPGTRALIEQRLATPDASVGARGPGGGRATIPTSAPASRNAGLGDLLRTESIAATDSKAAPSKRSKP